MTIDEMIAVLQAAREDKVIQRRANARFRDSGEYNDWIVVNSPSWNFHLYDYRVKPEVLRYKVALMRYPHDGSVTVICNTETACRHVENNAAFVRWLTDWQEVEV